MRLYTCVIKNADDYPIARKFFRTREEASAEQDHMLEYEFYGFYASPLVEAVEVPDNEAAALIGDVANA